MALLMTVSSFYQSLVIVKLVQYTDSNSMFSSYDSKLLILVYFFESFLIQQEKKSGISQQKKAKEPEFYKHGSEEI